MLDGVDVDVVQMELEIPVVSDPMLVEPLLPHASVPLPAAPGCAPPLRAPHLQVRFGEVPLDLGDSDRKAVIFVREAHQHVQVLGKQDDGVQDKSQTLPGIDERLPKDCS
jgi:hypothetical protein